jgi:hypothetical protein
MRLPLFGLATALALGTALPATAQNQASKLDEAVTQSLHDGCATQKVIIRTKAGYRSGMALSLRLHGDRIASEHPSIDAVSAEVHCDDLPAIQAFASVLSISKDAVVRADGATSPANTSTQKSAQSGADGGDDRRHRRAAFLRDAGRGAGSRGSLDRDPVLD